MYIFVLQLFINLPTCNKGDQWEASQLTQKVISDFSIGRRVWNSVVDHFLLQEELKNL